MDSHLGYAELHAHSNSSFLDGVASVEEMVLESARLQLSGLAITDHNGLYAVARFARAASDAGVRAVFGAELTLEAVDKRTGNADPAGHHLVVLAKSPRGYSRLSTAITKGHLTSGEKGRFRLDLDGLAELCAGDCLVLTGCRKGSVPSALMTSGPSAAKKELRKLIERFGREDVYVECWDHSDPIDTQRNREMVSIALSEGVTPVATGNAHYPSPSWGRLAHLVSAIRSNRTMDQIDGWLPSSFARHLRSPAEQYRRFSSFPGLVETSLEVASRCAFDLSLVAPNLPGFLVPTGYSEIGWLRSISYSLAESRYGPRSQERVRGAYAQIDYELRIIDELGFAGYFLVVWDIVEFCRKQGIFCQGRGSAANSAVCYAIGITNADPVSLKLLFERFLSPERDGPPDIDVDIESDRREEVIQYVFSRYGREMAAQVASVITFRSKSAIREVGKALGYPLEVVNGWSRRVERWGSVDASASVLDHRGRRILELPDQVRELASAIEHNPRHLGLHVGGMVICDRPISEVCPIEWARSRDRTVLQWDKDDCALVGLVKFDLLGLGMLSALHEMVDIVDQVHGRKVDISMLDQEDAVYEMLSVADSVGVFQVESRAQMATLPRLKPRSFYDLVVEVALIRPGPIQGGSVHPYIRRRNGLEAVTYLHPLLERSLSKTLGIPLFQEQLMQMAMDVAGFTPAEADQLRQAMGSKRSTEKMHRLKDRFYRGMAENGIVGDVADQIFEKLSAFANFGFPESHSASFAYLVYASSWFKLHYPAAFCAALLRSQPMGFWSPQTLLADARRHGVDVKGPVVGISQHWATLEEGAQPPMENDRSIPYIYPSRPPDEIWPAIRLGIDSIFGISRNVAKRIVEGVPYVSLVDLAQRASLSRPQMEALARAGALSGFGGGSEKGLSRREALWMAAAAQRVRRDSLPLLMDPIRPPEFAELTPLEEMSLDAKSIGVTPSGHPMELIRRGLSSGGVLSAAQLWERQDGTRVKVAGVVTHRQRPATANGVTFINLEDETGLMNIICTKGAWVRFREVAKLNPALLVTGMLERRDGVLNIVATKISPLELAAATKSRDFH